jgi:WD40 repeat protein/serine/threonine protein kinase
MTEAPLNHPGDAALRALSLGQLAEVELGQICAHLGDCPACCRRIDQLATDDRLLARLQQCAGSREDLPGTPVQRRAAVRALRQLHESKSATPHPSPSTLDAPPSTLNPPLSTAPRQVGDYDILAEVGRGGMGVVYQARHRGLHRLAALKMVLAGEFASPSQELRFRLEAELAARVQHPNIVQVYEIGSYEGRPFLALEWVNGGSLADRLLDGKPWPPGEAAALIETLARAIDVAHAEGVVHRDLKPANIMLVGNAFRGNRGGDNVPKLDGTAAGNAPCDVLAGGRAPHEGTAPESFPTPLVPKISDFGLAQTIEGGRTMTQSGFLVGTPGYMAPEQAGGKRALVGPATDIYALGVMLYRLLTGQLPFQRDSTLELLRAVTSDEPTRPRRLQPRVPRDLEAITLHCLEKEPRQRYPSALALAEDLQRFREGKQVVARPVGAVARLARACRRRPLVALLLVLLAVSLFAGMGGVTWKWREANQQRDRADQQRDLAIEQRDRADAQARRADEEKQEALYQAYRACRTAASTALANHNVDEAAEHLKLAPESLRDWEWRYMHNRLDESSAMVPLPGGHPFNGFLIAAPDRLRIGVLTSSCLRITDLEGVEQRTVPLGPEHRTIATVTQTSRGLRLAAWTDDTVDLLDDAGKVLCRMVRPNRDVCGYVCLSPDGKRVAFVIGAERRQVALFDATSGKQTALCQSHSGFMKICFSPDGTRLAAGSQDSMARVWDAATGTLLATCQGHAKMVRSVTFSPDGARLVTASEDGTVQQWNSRTGQLIEVPYDRHGADVFSAVYSPDGQWVASVGRDRLIRVWRARGRQDLAVLHGHTGYVTEVAFAPGGRRLASSCHSAGDISVHDDSVRVWDVDSLASLPVLHGHTGSIAVLTYSPDGRWLASGSYDNAVRLWDPETGEPCVTLPHPSFVSGLAFGPDSTWLVTGCYQDDRLRVWDVATARMRKEIPYRDREFRFHSLTVSPDGTRVAATAQDAQQKNHRLTVFDIASGKSLFSTKGLALAYSPDGRWLAVRAEDEKKVLLLDARTHETIGRFSVQEKIVSTLAAFSPDSRCLAWCSQDRTVRLWQIDGSECRVLRGHSIGLAVAFNPDGTRVATGGFDDVVRLWDVARGEEVARLPGNGASLAFSPDGTTLASGSFDATVRLWDTAPLKTRYDARREAAALRPEAERLVEQLWRAKNGPAEVVAALRADRALSEALRQAALRAVLRRSQPPADALGKPQDPP